MLFKMRMLIAICLCFFAIACRNSGGGETLPSFDFLLPDSTTHINTNAIPTGNPIALLYFSPDCEHCQHETETIIHHMDSLKHVHFYFITNDPPERIKIFKEVYNLDKYANITLWWDNQFFFPRHFKGASPPYLVLYDRQKRMQGAFEGGLEASEMVVFVNKL